MDYEYNNDNKNIFQTDLFRITLLSTFAFLVPILFSQITLFPNQLLIGTIVNAFLCYSALRYNLAKSLPIILLPSIGALVSGIVFHQFSIFLVYLIPAIWLGNLTLWYFIKRFAEKRVFATAIASLTKTTIIFGFTLTLYLFDSIPKAFLIPMSVIQLITAICGCTIVFLFIKNKM